MRVTKNEQGKTNRPSLNSSLRRRDRDLFPHRHALERRKSRVRRGCKEMGSVELTVHLLIFFVRDGEDWKRREKVSLSSLIRWGYNRLTFVELLGNPTDSMNRFLDAERRETIRSEGRRSNEAKLERKLTVVEIPSQPKEIPRRAGFLLGRRQTCNRLRR